MNGKIPMHPSAGLAISAKKHAVPAYPSNKLLGESGKRELSLNSVLCINSANRCALLKCLLS